MIRRIAVIIDRCGTGPHPRSQAHVAFALGALRDEARGELAAGENRGVGQLRLQQGLRGGVAVREVDGIAVLGGNRRDP